MATTSKAIESVPISGSADGRVLVDEVDYARRINRLRERHWSMLCLSLFIIVASFLFRVQGSQTVGLIGLPNVALPPLCGSRVLFGVECPGCGLTRSFISLAAGN